MIIIFFLFKNTPITPIENIKKQSYIDQIHREKSSAISLVEAETGKGVKIDE